MGWWSLPHWPQPAWGRGNSAAQSLGNNANCVLCPFSGGPQGRVFRRITHLAPPCGRPLKGRLHFFPNSQERRFSSLEFNANIEHPTLNIEHRTQGSAGPGVLHFTVRCWMFTVRCSHWIPSFAPCGLRQRDKLKSLTAGAAVIAFGFAAGNKPWSMMIGHRSRLRRRGPRAGKGRDDATRLRMALARSARGPCGSCISSRVGRTSRLSAGGLMR